MYTLSKKGSQTFTSDTGCSFNINGSIWRRRGTWDSDLVQMATFSYSSNVRVERVSLESTEPVIKFSDIKGYVTALYDAFWWLACVVNKFPERNEIKVSFLHPHGSSRSFKYPQRKAVLIMNFQDVLSTVEPKTATGRTYTLTPEEITTTTKLLDNKLKIKE